MKIQIIGAAGAGKSTLADRIGQQTGIKVIETDRYLWADEFFTIQHPVSARIEMHRRDTKNDADYIVAGSTYTWDKDGFANRDLLVLLRLDEDIRMDRLRKREVERFGVQAFSRDDKGQLTNDFIEWCKTYMTADRDSPSSFDSHMFQIQIAKCRHLILDSNQDVTTIAKTVLDFYNGLGNPL